MTVDELSVLITANSEQFQKELGKVTSSISNMTKSAKTSTEGITKAFGVLKKGLVALGIGKVIKDSISTAMESIESDNLFEVSMGKLAKETYKWSEELSNALGLSAVAIRKNTGTIFNMTTSMGIAESHALSMAKGVSSLAEDMASFYNLDSATAFEKIQSGLTGMGQGLKALGILVDEDTIKQVAYNNGIAKVGAELTNQQKVLARYVAIMQQTKNAHGDLARTLESPANLIRRLKNEISNCANTIGTILMPIVSKALVYINAFVKVLSNALSSLASFLGFKSSLADDTLKASSNIGDLAGSMDDADKSAKSIKKSLAGFDEITNLTTKEDTDTSEVDASGIPIGFNLGDYDAGLDSIEDKTKKIVDKITKTFNGIKIKKIDFEPITKAINKLGEALKPFGVGIWNGLKWGIENVLSPLANFTIEDVLPNTLNLISGALNTITGNNTNEEAQAPPVAENAITEGILGSITIPEPIVIDVNTDSVDEARNNIISKFDEIRAEAPSLGATLSAIWDTNPLSTFVGALTTSVNSMINLVTTLGTNIVVNLRGTWDTVKKDLGAGIVNWTETWELFWHDVDTATQKWAPSITTKISSLFDGIYKDAIEPFTVNAISIWKDWTSSINSWWKEHGGKLADEIGGTIDTLVGYWNRLWDDIFAPIIKPFIEETKRLWDEHGKPMFDKILGLIAKVVEAFGEWRTKIFEPFSKWYLEHLKPIVSWIVEDAAKSISNAIGIVMDVIGGISDALSGVLDFLIGVFTLDWDKAWSGIKETYEGIVNSLDAIFKGALNMIIIGINHFIKGINKIKFDVPEWVPVIGGKKFGFDLKELPKLARGGIIDSPTIAMLGERGREAVVPLENNTEWLDKLAGKLFAMLNAVKDNKDDRPINVTVTSTLNGKVVSKELIRDLNKEAKRLGYKGILST